MTSSTEDRLRDAYRAMTDTVSDQDLPGLFQRQTWPRTRFAGLAPLAAAAAVLLVIAMAIAVPELASSPHGTPAASPAQAPPYLITLAKPDPHQQQGPLVVRSATTGRITGQVPAPLPGLTWYDVAPTGNGRMFVAAARRVDKNDSYLFNLTLSASGIPGEPQPSTVPHVHGYANLLRASADGSTIAFVNFGGVVVRSGEKITVVRGGKMKSWTIPQQSHTELSYVQSITLSADGSRLGYVEAGDHDTKHGGYLRILDTRSAPGVASTSSTVAFAYPAVAQTALKTALLGADLDRFYVAWTLGNQRRGFVTTIEGLRGDGKVLFVRHLKPAFVDILAWVGNQVLASGSGGPFYLVDPVSGAVTQYRTLPPNTYEVFW